MKKWTTLWIMIMMLGVSVPALGAMSISKMRQNTRFLTDRMAYELKLSPQQYDDVYEVNYDFINNVRYLENLPFGCSISSAIHFGPTIHPTRIVEKTEISGIKKLLLM